MHRRKARYECLACEGKEHIISFHDSGEKTINYRNLSHKINSEIREESKSLDLYLIKYLFLPFFIHKRNPKPNPISQKEERHCMKYGQI